MKYTAQEIVAKTGKNPEEVIGKVSVDIGGIPVSSLDHIVDTQASETVKVIVGTEVFDIELTEKNDIEMSGGVKSIRDTEHAEAERAEEVVTE